MIYYILGIYYQVSKYLGVTSSKDSFNFHSHRNNDGGDSSLLLDKFVHPLTLTRPPVPEWCLLFIFGFSCTVAGLICGTGKSLRGVSWLGFFFACIDDVCNAAGMRMGGEGTLLSCCKEEDDDDDMEWAWCWRLLVSLLPPLPLLTMIFLKGEGVRSMGVNIGIAVRRMLHGSFP